MRRIIFLSILSSALILTVRQWLMGDVSISLYAAFSGAAACLLASGFGLWLRHHNHMQSINPERMRLHLSIRRYDSLHGDSLNHLADRLPAFHGH